MMNEKCMIPIYLVRPLNNLFEHENTSQFRSFDVPNADQVNDFLKKLSNPFTLHRFWTIFGDTKKRLR